jgi:O-6-methylguanine DNA methyltransferase
VITYQELAARAGAPNAVRAVGTAMAVNAVAPFVPCHRVVKTGGEIGNYAYGSDMKVELLLREGLIVD